MNVNIVCRNYKDDRVLPRFARLLAEHTGWALTKGPVSKAELNYWFAYFERNAYPDFKGHPTAAFFTHIEEGDNAKSQLFHSVARDVDIRVSMNELFHKEIAQLGPGAVVPLPLERDRFTLADRKKRARPVAGFSGWAYKTGRKGGDLAEQLCKEFGDRVTFAASGANCWPCPSKFYPWEQMPHFYQCLDIYVCTALVEGGPMPTLEMMATGGAVVIPRGVGIHDQIPECPGVYRYDRGDYASLKAAFERAIEEHGQVDREAIREASLPHSVEAFVDAHRRLFEGRLYDIPHLQPAPSARCGFYVVAFGDPARACAYVLLTTIKRHMPNVPIALVSDRKLGPEDVLIVQPDADIGGRIAKLKVYDLAPQNWDCILYLDADMEMRAPVPFLFDLLKDGWEFLIAKDGHLHEEVSDFQRRNNTAEFSQTVNKVGTSQTLQINGGMWGFRRCDRTKRFFKRWFDEWNEYQGRDQGALLRALYTEPLRTYWLGNEWNTMVTIKGEEYPPGISGTAGIVHFVGRARRWDGQVPTGYGLTDSVAWKMVEGYAAAGKVDEQLKKAKKRLNEVRHGA